MREDSCCYEYSLDDSFFAVIDAPEIRKGTLKAEVKVRKGIVSYALAFHIEGVVTVSCDRCLDDMEIDVETDNSLNVKLGLKYSDEEEWITIPEEDGFINIAWLMYEFILLSLPMAHTHVPGECNEAMIGTLNQHLRYLSDEERPDGSFLGEDEGSTVGMDSQEIDPRWNALKKILNNN